eukprot:TRINITY_DN67833_c5_g2_i4.p1 TRINITY_DN67833_c5_g2~~TRINITY_DN67833_c5_g2_i4.p1  ORF type:complete len:162 (-),score=14.29 TRINITY_DN67833_c5_g2_i4:358-843(-)
MTLPVEAGHCAESQIGANSTHLTAFDITALREATDRRVTALREATDRRVSQTSQRNHCSFMSFLDAAPATITTSLPSSRTAARLMLLSHRTWMTDLIMSSVRLPDLQACTPTPYICSPSRADRDDTTGTPAARMALDNWVFGARTVTALMTVVVSTWLQMG